MSYILLLQCSAEISALYIITLPVMCCSTAADGSPMCGINYIRVPYIYYNNQRFVGPNFTTANEILSSSLLLLFIMRLTDLESLTSRTYLILLYLYT